MITNIIRALQREPHYSDNIVVEIAKGKHQYSSTFSIRWRKFKRLYKYITENGR